MTSTNSTKLYEHFFNTTRSVQEKPHTQTHTQTHATNIKYADLKYVKICQVTKSLRGNGKNNHFGNYGGNVKYNNDILLAMYQNKHLWIEGCHFDIYKKTSNQPIGHQIVKSTFDLRYRFHVLLFDGKILEATQSFLHYDGKQWMPCNTRKVYVELC